jgi:hypothetical protein
MRAARRAGTDTASAHDMTMISRTDGHEHDADRFASTRVLRAAARDVTSAGTVRAEVVRELPDASPELQDFLLGFRSPHAVTSRLTTTVGAAPSEPRAVEEGTPRSVATVTSAVPVLWTRSRRR